LRNEVLAIAYANAWSGKGKVSELRRMLFAGGMRDPISDDTLGRLVDALFRETGDERFRRRPRRKAAERGFTQNSTDARNG
jgi:hypothetical protein